MNRMPNVLEETERLYNRREVEGRKRDVKKGELGGEE
jgi:hypothetical protein